MRYYMYLDRPFLRTLFAVFDENEFNIDIVEYAVKRSYSNNNGLSLDPCIENGNSSECFDDKKEKERKKNNIFNNEKLRVGYNKGIAYNIQTEKKYVNISDIVDMKNIKFYHKLIQSIQSENTLRDEKRLYEEAGQIKIYNFRENEHKGIDNEGFFRINNTCVWYEKEKFNGNINMLSNIGCDVKVIGYLINNLNEECNKVLKAIAVYIE